MRVLHVMEAAGSGTLGVVSELSAGLLESGHDVAVAAGQRPETPADLCAVLPAGVELHPVTWARRTPAHQLRAARELRHLAEAWRPDIVHLHSSFAGAVGAVALSGWPTVYSPHAYSFARATESPVRRAAYRAAERFVARRCDVVGAVSEAEAELARREVRAPRVVAVPNGIADLDPGREPAPRSGRIPGVVAMGRIGPQRRPAETAWILSGVAHAAPVRWIGGAPAGEDAPLHAAGVPVSGWLARADALDALAEATVYLHWSAWDGQSLSILEAFARDVVVIASDIPANRELVGPAQVATTPAAARQLVLDVLADDARRAALLDVQRASRHRWAASRMVGDWIRVYDSLVTPHERPAGRGAPTLDTTPTIRESPWS
jgi:glycosyltransferase involved in cell wall biosynthesis